MSAARKQTTAKTTSRRDATTILKEDHEHVSSLFEAFERARSASRKKALVDEICQELTVHAAVEDEIFYPAFKKALKDHELVPEAKVEHETLKDLIAQIEDVEPGGEMYDARVKVLSEYVKHHVKEEQGEMFPKARKNSKLDLKELGTRIMERKEELKAQA